MTARATEDEDVAQQFYEFKFNMDTPETEPFIKNNSFLNFALKILQYHTIPCHAMPCHAMPYHTIKPHTLAKHTTLQNHIINGSPYFI